VACSIAFRRRTSQPSCARSKDDDVRQRAFETILASYWKSVKYVLLKWQADNEDAKHLPQGFFANAF
jgi:hypothetical protein